MATTVPTKQNKTLIFELYTNSEDDRPVFLAGNFNNWKVNDTNYQLTKVEDGHYQLKSNIVFSDKKIEYKYTRGNWASVELDSNGKERHNRIVQSDQEYVTDRIFNWKESAIQYKKSLLPVIKVISEAFEIPQLIRTRRIAALLPHDYHTSNKRYPVLYLQDGQNLFDDYAPYGSWALDKRLAALSQEGFGGLIVIAIDHAKEQRIREFTPSSNTKLGRGDGIKYVEFLSKTLKNYIDKTFRTLPDWANTCIGGSSMGGLISIYAGLMKPNIYGRMLIFSPSLWVTPNIPFQLLHLTSPYNGRVYLYGGRKESETMVPNLKRFQKALEDYHPDTSPEFKLSIDPQGEHNEDRWGKEFPKAIKWLFFNEQTL